MQKILDKVNSHKDLKKLSIQEMTHLAREIREFLIEVISKTGGHLGSNLGVVELTLALHYVFDPERDIFVWDISNQTYVHKILTGRKDKFATLRQYKGLSGFASKYESPYDPFIFGHAGTSISTALGIATSDAMRGKKRKVIAIIGDGALTEGVAYEGLNNCGYLGKDLLVILNDNKWSISRTVGAVSRYLTRIRISPLYREAKAQVRGILSKIPLGNFVLKLLRRIREAIKEIIFGQNIFTALGFKYHGPIDGHNLSLLIKTLRDIKNIRKPVLLHVLTQKAKGHPDADKEDISELHSISPLSTKGVKTYTHAFSRAIVELARVNPKVVAITAAMTAGAGLTEFAKLFKERFFDVGISEQHAVAFAAGLAHQGFRPVVAIYSTFLQRAYDQIFQEVCLQDLPVVFVLDRSGLVGEDGPTHHGLHDIAYLRTFPNIVLFAPKDAEELEQMLKFALELNYPCAIRYPKAPLPDFGSYHFKQTPIQFGKAEKLFDGDTVALIAYGSMVETAIKVRNILLDDGVSCSVINARFAKPIDRDMIIKAVYQHRLVVTLEEHSICGGFGSAVLEEASSCNLDLQKIKILGVPDKFIEHATREIQFEICNLTPRQIYQRIKELLQFLVRSNDTMSYLRS